MGGFLRGAILGLGCGVIALTIMAMVFPSVDPAKYSEAPDATSKDTPVIAAPNADDDDAVDSSGEDGAIKTTPGAPLEPAGKAEIDPNIDVAALEITPQEPEPKSVQTPAHADKSNVTFESDTEVERKEAKEATPETIAEEAARVLTKQADPVEIDVPDGLPVTPSDEQGSTKDSTDPQTPAMPAKPKGTDVPDGTQSAEGAGIDTEVAPQNRIQSEAESQNEPPLVLDNSPDVPRAIVMKPVAPGSFGKRVGNFVDAERGQSSFVTDTQTNRLPSISSDADSDDTIGQKPNALRDNGVAFAATGQPLIGVLVTEGQDRSQDAARVALIQDIGLPITVGLNPLEDGAEERAIAYAKAGADIVILSNLPGDATPQDIEVTLAAYQDMLPMAVAVMDLPQSDLNVVPRQLSRITLQHVLTILRDNGLGLVAKQKGLNTAIQLAEKNSVPNVQIFHNITASETQNRLRTIFNRAVFRATQKGASVVTIPGDVSSLRAFQAWSLVDRPSSVQMAPISAILLGVASR